MSYSRGTRFACDLIRVGYCVSSLVDALATDESLCAIMGAISQSTSGLCILKVAVNLACSCRILFVVCV